MAMFFDFLVAVTWPLISMVLISDAYSWFLLVPLIGALRKEADRAVGPSLHVYPLVALLNGSTREPEQFSFSRTRLLGPRDAAWSNLRSKSTAARFT